MWAHSGSLNASWRSKHDQKYCFIFTQTLIQFEKMQSAISKSLPVSVRHAVIYLQNEQEIQIQVRFKQDLQNLGIWTWRYWESKTAIHLRGKTKVTLNKAPNPSVAAFPWQFSEGGGTKHFVIKLHFHLVFCQELKIFRLVLRPITTRHFT